MGSPSLAGGLSLGFNIRIMKRIFVISFILVLTSTLFAQYQGDGYYRVYNKATSRYIYVLDNTGSINYATTSADMGAIELHKDTARLHYDPACIIFANKVSATEDIFDLKAQGTGVHDIIGYYVTVYQKSDGSYQVYAEGKYLDDQETSLRDLGFLGFDRTGDYRLWYINKVNNTSQYFGILPTVRLGNKYYKPFYADFPFSVLSAGVRVYYISKVYRNAAILTEVTGVVPAATPVFIECSSPNYWSNRINIGGTPSTTIANNKLGAVYFNNPNRRKSHDARTAFNPATMRVLSVTSDGHLCFAKNTSLVYLPANESFLNVPTTADDTLLVMTAAEYEIYSKASSITLDRHSISLYPDQSASLAATILPSTVAVTTVNWTSSNPSVVRVDAQGNLTALSVGRATITASTTDGTNLSDTCSVIVNPVIASGLSLSRGLFSGIAGDTATLVPVFVPLNTTNQNVVWTTSNAAVATVENGLVTIRSVGMATVTATATDGSGVSASCSVVGNAVKVTGMQIVKTYGPSTDSLRTFDNFTLSAVVLPSNATSKSVTWSSSNSSGLRIISQNDSTCSCQALSAGNFVITASAQDGSQVTAQIAVTVLPTLAESLTLAQDSVRMSLGDVIRFTYTLLPAETTDKSVLWATSDSTVVSVTQQGVCAAEGVGEAVITLSTLDGSGLVAQSVIMVSDTVVPPTLASSLVLSEHQASLRLGDSLMLSYTLLPLETTDPTVEWFCSDSTVIAFDLTGRCYAVGLGSAYIVISTVDGSNISDTCFFTVNPILAESITLSRTDTTLHVEDFFSLSCTVLPANTTDPAVSWTSSDSAIVSVDNRGRCRARNLGSAVITVSTLDGSGLSASCSVMVTPVLAESLVLSDTSITLTIGDSAAISAQVFPANVTNPAVFFESLDAAIAQVDNNGNIKAVGVGNTFITVSTADGSGISAVCLVNVEPVYVTSITLNVEDSLILWDNNDSQTLIATVLPENATIRTVEWSTSDSTVISVNQEGRVTGHKAGFATVYVASTDGSNIVATCPVRVKIWTDLLSILAADPNSVTIYDLLGRRLYRIPAPGFYIVNGKVTYIVK